MATSSLYGTFKLSPDAAIKWFEKKGLTPSWDWFELWEQAHAKSFTVAKSMSYDILGDIQQATEQALKQGLTKRQYRQLLEKKLKAKGWWGKQTVINPKTGKPQVVQLGSPWRLNTIYRTNMQSAMMAGRWKRFYENKRNRPYLQYIAVMDAATRHSHAELHGKIFHIDDPIWNTIYPPNGFNCRCRVRALTEKQAAQRGYKPKQKTKVSDDFPDRGFSHHVGKNQQALRDKLISSWNKINTGATKKLANTQKNQPPPIAINPGSIDRLQQQKALQALLHRDDYASMKEYIKNPKIQQKINKYRLTETEAIALHYYTFSGHEDVNKLLRRLIPGESNLIIYSQILQNALDKLPNHKGKVIRRTKIPDSLLKQHEIGKIVRYDGFTSSSFGKDVFTEYNHRLIITSKTGKKINWISDFDEIENEVLFKHPTKFRVESIENLPDGTIQIELCEI